MRRGGAGEEEEWVSKRRTRGWASSKRRRRRSSCNSRKSGSGRGEACGWREGRRRGIQISNFEIVAPPLMG